MKASRHTNHDRLPATRLQYRKVEYTRAVSGPSKRSAKNSVKRPAKRTAKPSRKDLRSAPKQTNQKQAKQAASPTYEAEVLPGLEPFTLAELKGLKGVQQVKQAEGAVAFRFVGDAARLLSLKTVTSVYEVLTFAVPRPKALLGHEHLSRLTKAVSALQTGQFSSFRLSAAGDDSAVFKRLGEELGRATGLRQTSDSQETEGDLLIRVRRAPEDSWSGGGWEVLLRLTPRPLSARAWRVCNLPGGLNAALAAVMVSLADLKPGERVFNPMCGSGTLLIEAGLGAEPGAITLRGCDQVPAALACSAQNVAAAGLSAELFAADATMTGLAEGSVDVFLSDPPWGDAVGTHGDNAALYPALLAECARIAAPGARFVLLSHEVRLLERLLEKNVWQLQTQFRVFHGGHYPRVYLLEKV